MVKSSNSRSKYKYINYKVGKMCRVGPLPKGLSGLKAEID